MAFCAQFGIRLRLDLGGEVQIDLPHPVDFTHDDLHLVSQRHVVLDTVDTTVRVDLGDVEQAVTTGKDVDERTELGDVHDFTVVFLANLGFGWERHLEDPLLGGRKGVTVGRTDANDAFGSVLLDLDRRSRFFFEFTDVLALRTDDLTDLVLGDSHGLDPRGPLVEFRPRTFDCGPHRVQDRQTSVLCLLEGTREHLGWQPFDLRVHLQRSDHIGGSRDLEVHVAECIFCTDDVGERDELTVDRDQTHRDARDRLRDRHTGVHERQTRRTDRRHRRRTVGRQHLGDETQCIREFITRRHDGKHRLLGKSTVADLATLRATHESCLADRERREVVVVHEPFALLDGERVEHLLHLEHPERGDVQHLGLATFKQAGAVCARYQSDFRMQRTYLGRTASVHADTFVDDPLTHQRLLDLLQRLLRHGQVFLVQAELGDDLFRDATLCITPLVLSGNADHLGELRRGHGLDPCVQLVAVIDGGRPFDLGDVNLLDEL